MKYAAYVVWTEARIIEAEDEADAYAKAEPVQREGLNLCNWHVVPVLEPVQREHGAMGACEASECKHIALYTVIDDRHRMWRVCEAHRTHFTPKPAPGGLRLHLEEKKKPLDK